MPKLEEISKLSASSIGRVLASREVSATKLTEYFLKKAKNAKSDQVFIKVTEERALAEAHAADKRLKAGQPLSPLDGVPLVWKDLFDISGEVTTAASAVYRNAPKSVADAEVVFNLTAAGMISLGKVNLSEFAFSGLGLNPHFGTPENPYGNGSARAPGGSSSGTAVAVAKGLAPCGIGTDTGGSVRIPASFNGLVGFKPTEGRISKQGVFPLSRTLDTIGPIARSVEDCIHLDAALRGKVSTEVKRRAITGVSIFIPDEIVFDGASPEVEANFFRSIRALECCGARIARGPTKLLREASDLMRDHGTIAAADAYAEHYKLMQSKDAAKIDKRVVDRILGGKKMSAYDHIKLQRDRASLINALSSFVGDGLVAMPTTAITAPEIEALESDEDFFHQTNSLVLRNTGFGNFLNMPGLALPNGFDNEGLPTSILLSSIPGRDDPLLGYGLGAESIVVSDELEFSEALSSNSHHRQDAGALH